MEALLKAYQEHLEACQQVVNSKGNFAETLKAIERLRDVSERLTELEKQATSEHPELEIGATDWPMLAGCVEKKYLGTDAAN